MWVLREAEVRYRTGLRLDGKRPTLGRIGSSRDVAAMALACDDAMGLYSSLQERFVVLGLSAKNQPVGWSCIGKGSLTTCPVSPSDVYRFLLMVGAVGCILLHNHPSGDPTPSADDVALTDRLRKAGDLVGVRVLDHIIIGRGRHFSFLDAGLFHGSL